MDVELKPEDLAFSEYPEPITGGMHVGLPKGVMAVHLPTGIKVVCNHERSQHMNRDACLRAISAALNTRHGAGDGEDAARYRWLRDQASWWLVSLPNAAKLSVMLPRASVEAAIGTEGCDFDAAIEAARAGERG